MATTKINQFFAIALIGLAGILITACQVDQIPSEEEESESTSGATSSQGENTNGDSFIPPIGGGQDDEQITEQLSDGKGYLRFYLTNSDESVDELYPIANDQTCNDETCNEETPEEGSSTEPPSGAIYKRIVITVTQIQIHSEELGWNTVANYGSPGKSIDLMTIQNGLFAELGSMALPVGTYTQIRLKLNLANFVEVEHNGHDFIFPLIVPSAQKSGLKITGPFTVADLGSTTFRIRFDAARSLKFLVIGYMMKPTLKLVGSLTEPCIYNLVNADTGGIFGIIGKVLLHIPPNALSSNALLCVDPGQDPGQDPGSDDGGDGTDGGTVDGGDSTDGGTVDGGDSSDGGGDTGGSDGSGDTGGDDDDPTDIIIDDPIGDGDGIFLTQSAPPQFVAPIKVQVFYSEENLKSKDLTIDDIDIFTRNTMQLIWNPLYGNKYDNLYMIEAEVMPSTRFQIRWGAKPQ